MSALFDSSKFIDFPKNRYEALNEVQSFLEYNGVDLGKAFEVLLKSGDGYLSYWFGHFEIQFVRGFGVWSESQDSIQMSILLEKDGTEEAVVYEYKLRDLKLIKTEKRLESRYFGVKSVERHYVMKDGKILRKNPFCPRCGTGVFMADKGEWWSCGKCGDRYNKKGFG